MKDYLARYLKEEDEDLKDPGGTALTKLTKPPPEDSFVSFVSAQPLGSPEHGAPQSCPRCGRDLAMSQTKLHRHLWCEGEGCIAYERWEAIGEGGNLSAAFPGPTGRQLLAAALVRNQCPGCQEPLTLQDRALDSWCCPGCRLWVVGGQIR